MKRAVITGLGPITCVGIGKEAFWDGLRAQKSGIDRLTAFDSSEYNAHHAGEVRAFDPTEFFPPHRLKRLDRYAQFAVASARLALADAGLVYTPDDPQARVGVSFGTALGGIAGAEFQHAHFLKKGTRGVNQTLALQVFGGSAHTNIAIEFGLRGVGTTNSNSCASGTVAVGEALRYIRDGLADVIVAGAAEAPLSPLTFSAFALIKTMSQWEGEPAARACRPFDRTRDGFVMGEGAAALIVEEYEHAKAARRAHLRGGVGLQPQQRRLSHDQPAARRRVRHRRDARGARRRAAASRADRLRQRARQQHPGQRRDGDARYQDRIGRPRVQDPRQRHEGLSRASARRDGRHRDGRGRVGDGPRLGPPRRSTARNPIPPATSTSSPTKGGT